MTKSEKERLHKLASNNELRQVINILLELDASHSEYIALSAQMAECEQNSRIKADTAENLQVKKNQILKALLELIGQIEVTEPESQSETIHVDEKKDIDGESNNSLVASQSIEVNVDEAIQVETQPKTTDETGEMSTIGKENGSVATSNSNEMNAYDFYLDAHKKMVKFVMACEQWSPGNKHKDKALIEGISATLSILPKLYSCLKSEGKEDQYFLEEIELCISEVNLLQREMVSINVASVALRPTIRLKLFEPQKKINAIILNIAEKLQIDFASEKS